MAAIIHEGWCSRALYELEVAGWRERLLHHGMEAIKQPRAIELSKLALGMAGRVLKPQGSALINVSEGTPFQELAVAARRQFQTVRFLLPET